MIAAIAISHRAISDQTQRLRMQLCGLAADLSLLVDAEAHGRLAALGEQAGEDPAFPVLRAKLDQFQSLHPEVRFVYTMAELPETSATGVVAFVCDPTVPEDANGNGVIDPVEQAADPGERYDAKQSPQLIKGFAGPVADEDFSSDQWGSWLSGYAPIRAADGTVTGLVGVDMPVDHIDRLRRDFLIHAAILLVSTLIAFGAAGWLVAMRMKRPIAALQKGMESVSRGDLEAKVVVTSGDEFEDLANSFEHMRRQLNEAQAVRGAFEAFVARTLSARQGAIPGAEVHRAVLYLDVERLRSQQISAVMPRLLHAVFEHGGVVERTVAEGFVAAFPLAHLADCPEERALRAALSMLAGEHAEGLRIGIDAGPERERTEVRAIALAQANDRIGSDLMVSAAAFAPARSGFYADRCDLGPVLAEGWAVKGAVSAR
jgi:HAMP domain-containing protein